MNIKYTWKHTDQSNAAEDYANKKIERISKYVHNIQSCEISFEMIHNQIKSNLNLFADGNHFNAQNMEKEIYECIDGLEEKILKQVRKFHDKKTSH